MGIDPGQVSVEVGSRLGSYDITAALGSGGMGQVFRARDTRLERDVAIKVLPPHLATDEAAHARFEREAKAVAALSHPNILAIYDVGSTGGTAYVVMELLEGETLRGRLGATTGSASMPVRKATQIAIEIANGLAAAHDKQIVHRDIKPENVFIASDGRVKILDFGLARQTTPTGTSSSEGATQLQQTDPGTVLGTVGYMAPEQVKAQPVDHRADIFALGCVLYEMVCGRRPFVRDSAAETMSAILRDDPPNLDTQSGVIPAALEPIIRHCLEKRPEERFQSARDLAFALQSLSSASHPAVSAVAESPKAPVRRRGLVNLLLAAGVAAVAFFAGRGLAINAGDGASAPHVASFQQVTDAPGVETSPALSPDGKTLLYVSDSSGSPQIYSQRVGSRTAKPLTSTASNGSPAFSPDGERIAFWSSRDGGGVFLMSAEGESVTRLSPEGFSPAWSPSGTEVAITQGTFISPADLGSIVPGLFVVDASSRQKRDVLKSQMALQPSWSPHGHRIAYFSLRTNSGQRDILTAPVDGSAVDAGGTDVTNDAALDWSPVWSPDGNYLYFSSNRGGTMNLWRVRIDERSGRTLGEPEPVTTPATYSGWMSFSRDGDRVAYASLDWRSTLLRQDFDAAKEVTIGPPTPLLKGGRPIRDHAISPDRQWIAFNETSAQEDLFVARVGGQEYRRLTDDAFRDRGPNWTPDSSKIFFYSDRGGRYDLWSIPTEGGALVQHTKGAQPNFPVISPDGRFVALSGVRAQGFTIRDLSTPIDQPDSSLPPPAAGQVFWPFSWARGGGGRLVGLVISPTGVTGGAAVYDVGSKQYRRIHGNEDTAYAVMDWLQDGKRFLMRTRTGVWLVNSETGAMKALTRVGGYYIGRSLSVSSDDRWYSYTDTGTEGDIWIATIKR